MWKRLSRLDDDFAAKCLDPAERSGLTATNETHRKWATSIAVADLILLGLHVFSREPSPVLLTALLLGVVTMFALRSDATTNLRILKLAEASALESRAQRPRAA